MDVFGYCVCYLQSELIVSKQISCLKFEGLGYAGYIHEMLVNSLTRMAAEGSGQSHE